MLGFELEDSQQVSSLNITQILGPLFDRDRSLVCTLGEIIDSSLDIGVDLEVDNALRRLAVQTKQPAGRAFGPRSV
jgi:hypothetical protein